MGIVPQEWLDWVKQSLDAGVPRTKIRQELESQGLSEREARGLVREVKERGGLTAADSLASAKWVIIP